MTKFADAPGCIEWQDLILFSTLSGRVWRGIDIWIETFPNIPVGLSRTWNCFFLVPVWACWSAIKRYGFQKLLVSIIWPWQVVDTRRRQLYPDGPRQDVCKGLGVCCNPVEAPTREWILEEMERQNNRVFPLEDVKFVLEVLRPISLEEGYRRNPYLRQKHASFGATFKIQGEAFNSIDGERMYRFYECPYFEVESRRCAVHGTPFKPPLCRNYPLYSKTVCDKLLMTPECGYHALRPEVQTVS